MKPYGIDISKYQGTNINYKAMKDKTKYVIMRAGISYAYEDPTFGPNWKALKGHHRGAYHVVYPGQDPIQQANHFLNVVTKHGVDWRTDRLALDLELHQSQTRSRITYVTTEMMNYIKEHTGRYPILYSRATWVDQYMNVTPKLANADWWLANYLSPKPHPEYTPEHPGPPMLPRGVGKYLIHQTGEKGKGKDVGVGSYYVDENRWNGTINSLNKYFGKTAGYHLYFPIVTNEEAPTNPMIEIWSQRDPRWANDIMGSSGITMAQQGCLMTATAWVLKQLGFDIDPGRYNHLASTRGGYAPPNLMYWKFPEIIFKGKVERAEYRSFNGNGWQSLVDSILDDGRIALAMVDMSPRTGFQQHWIAIYKKDGNTYRFADPWNGDSETLAERYQEVFKIVSYRKL